MKDLLCGVDLGGTKIAVAIITPDGTILNRTEKRDHRGKNEDIVVSEIAEEIDRLLHDRRLSWAALVGIGVGTSGHVNHHTGTVITNSNLPGFTDYPIGDKLRDATSLPVRVDNDANAQAYAEYRFGASRGFDNNVFVTVSTGIGSGIIIDGRLYRGITGTAGEIGHTIVKPDSSIQCGCGNYGCLMAQASGSTLPQVVRDKLRAPGASTGIDFSILTDAQITGELIGSGLRAGDPLCTAIVAEYAHFMGIGLQNIFQVLNPGLIVLGGGLTAWGTVYLDQIRTTFYDLAGSMMTERTEIRTADLGVDAAVIGAAALLLEPT